MKKRGILMLPRAAVQIIIVGLLVVFAFGTFSQLYGATFGDEDEEASKRNFQNLENAVRKVLADPDPYSSTKLAFYIHKDHLLAGFDENAQRLYKQGNEQGIFVPTYCDDKPCLCLYEESIDENNPGSRDKDVIRPCAKFVENVVFVGEWRFTSSNKHHGQLRKDYEDYDEIPEDKRVSFEYLLYYGVSRKISEVYVEKFETNGKIMILITPSSYLTELRSKYLITCDDAEYTEEVCRGKNLDEVTSLEDKIVVCLEKDSGIGCYAREITECEDGEIKSQCACGDTAYSEGFCQNDKFTTIDCSSISSCGDYCKSAGALVWCNSDQEKRNCNENQCLDGVCSIKDKIQHSGGDPTVILICA